MEQCPQHGRCKIYGHWHHQFLPWDPHGQIWVYENAPCFIPWPHCQTIQPRRKSQKWFCLLRDEKGNLWPPPSGIPRQQAPQGTAGTPWIHWSATHPRPMETQDQTSAVLLGGRRFWCEVRWKRQCWTSHSGITTTLQATGRWERSPLLRYQVRLGLQEANPGHKYARLRTEDSPTLPTRGTGTETRQPLSRATTEIWHSGTGSATWRHFGQNKRETCQDYSTGHRRSIILCASGRFDRPSGTKLHREWASERNRRHRKTCLPTPWLPGDTSRRESALPCIWHGTQHPLRCFLSLGNWSQKQDGRPIFPRIRPTKRQAYCPKRCNLCVLWNPQDRGSISSGSRIGSLVPQL